MCLDESKLMFNAQSTSSVRYIIEAERSQRQLEVRGGVGEGEGERGKGVGGRGGGGVFESAQRERAGTA